MYSGQQILDTQREAALLAARQQFKPFLVWPEDIAAYKRGEPFPFPFLGTYVPKGWRFTGNEYFVDASGFGGDDEPALSLPQFADKLREGYGYAVYEAGQFQVYIREYERTAPHA